MRSLSSRGLPAWGVTVGSGSLELTLTLPTEPDLRPTGMTTVRSTATAPGDVAGLDHERARRQPVRRGRSPGRRGRPDRASCCATSRTGSSASARPARPIDIVGDEATALAIPVRRPFVYASSGTALYSFDPTLDPRDMKFQGMVGGVAAPAVHGLGRRRSARDRVGRRRCRSSSPTTNTVDAGRSRSRPARAMRPRCPGTHKLAIAHAPGSRSSISTPARSQTATVGAVDRVTRRARRRRRALRATASIGRVAAARAAAAARRPAPARRRSSPISVDAPATVARQAARPSAVSDLAAAPDVPRRVRDAAVRRPGREGHG